MDDKLIAQVKATAKALREAASQTEQELSDAEAERAAIDARIEQLGGLLDQLNAAAKQADETAGGGGSGRAAPRKKATAKRTSSKKATRKKATRKQPAITRITPAPPSANS